MTAFDPQALQQKYEQWHKLHQQIEAAQAQWQHASQLLSELQAYYQSEQWREDYERDLPLECSGEVYSILNQDTLWDALTDHRAQAIEWMKLGLDAIENQ